MKDRYTSVCDSILNAVGYTPLIRLNKVTEGIRKDIEIYAKVEFLNPMGSVKDRVAKYMIEKAEKEGRITNGQLIIENSSGNTALGLAMVAVQKGYKLKVIVRDSLSKEKMDQLKALGVDIHQVDSTLPPESPDSYNNITPRMAKDLPGCYFPDQHNNRENNETHYMTTGPEIWEQMDGKIDYFVSGLGTGGTISGTSRYLKEQNPQIRVIGVDPVGSIFHDYFHTRKIVPSSHYYIEGLGDEFLINCVEFDRIDDMYQVSDRESFHHARKLVKEEGILGGGSSGAALWGVLKLARSLDHPARIVTVFPDSASRYLSTIFNDQWMESKGLL
ncbi:MAG: PLP-dependent cysteine synthase family protein [Candidatus Omnitrophota bacterium]